MKTIKGAVTAPKGFKAAGVRCGLKQSGNDFAMIVSDVTASAAGLFTNNVFCAAPVTLDREKLKDGKASVIIANSGNANASTGAVGMKNAEDSCALAAKLLGKDESEVLCASTGVIGHLLDTDKLFAGIKVASMSLSEEGGTSAAKAIMTTDTVAKHAAAEFEIGGVKTRMGIICKGSGMICPNVATMLCFITTDAEVAPDTLKGALIDACERSFNSLSVDGDGSTNDTVIILANGLSGCGEIKPGTPEYTVFSDALTALCVKMAKAMAADGEGATKYIEIRVKNAATYGDAKLAAKTIANSALVKTAVFGEDPNWGRVLAAAGRSGAKMEAEKTSLWFGDVKIFEKGEPLPLDPDTARAPMLEKELVITVDFGIGSENATAFTCDFSYDYVKINAEYHT
ncbi:MAG: bifunctional glutamate N-acetyltransferase/amino-acid acetyltransferase ArgJ [Abditibacteriota bacterium]|nr:bifunctional glutamate N-acetyltransferase/amino-acid acetyltransferase ArgJ [Abditibacteriota bacterium]MBP5738156.1 bifunctional glutamate N-acetyltransferase/amino-acid acetyltransferase ArgJ [Abditibacteriota bacterium]